MLITSLQNPQVKDAVKLRNRSNREKAGRMIIEGTTEITRAVRNQYSIEKIFLCPETTDSTHNDIVEECRSAGTEIIECSEQVYRKISYRDSPNGLIAIAPAISNSLASLDPSSATLLLVAESIEKPGNLGAIIRSADAAGANAVIVCDRSTDISNPNVIRASIGTIFCIPVIEASSDETITWLKANHIKICATSPDAKTTYTDTDMTGPSAIVLGTEHEGLTDKWLNAAQSKLQIPMLGKSDSLNVSASATILLYEAVRQRALNRKG